MSAADAREVRLERQDPKTARQERDSRRFLLTFLGGWVGALLFFGTIAAAVGLFFARSSLEDLGNLGYLGVFVIALLGNIPIVPAFPWLILIAPMGGIYPTWGLVLVGATGAGLGELVPFFLATSLYKAHKTHRWIDRLSSLPGWGKVLAVFAISLSPVFSCPGLASGILRVPLWAMAVMKVTTEAAKLWLVLEMVNIADRLLLT